MLGSILLGGAPRGPWGPPRHSVLRLAPWGPLTLKYERAPLGFGSFFASGGPSGGPLVSAVGRREGQARQATTEAAAAAAAAPKFACSAAAQYGDGSKEAKRTSGNTEEALRPLDLDALRSDVEEYLISNSSSSSSSSSGKMLAAERLLEHLLLLSPARLQQLPAADLLLLLRVYSRLLTASAPVEEPPAAAAAAAAAVAHAAGSSSSIAWQQRAAAHITALRLFLKNGSLAIVERPLDFLLPQQLIPVLAVAASIPPACAPLEFWRCLLRRCVEAARLLPSAAAARLLLGLAYLPRLPDEAGLSRAASAVCSRVAEGAECLARREALLDALEALRLLQQQHLPLLTEI
ncbi:hypothetical protein, conserved, partial [Eimeria tenella]